MPGVVLITPAILKGHKKRMTNNPENLLKITDVAARLNVSRITVYRLIKAGKLQTVRIGKNLRIQPAELAAYIEANKNDPQSCD